MWLLHGTTRDRAERILQYGPDVHFVEPEGMTTAGNISFTIEGMESVVGESVTYARGKAVAFPNERGPSVIAIDVPDEIVRMAAVEHLSLFGGLIVYNEGADLRDLAALCGGVIQFDSGPALDHLLSQWSTYVKVIRGVP